MFSALRPTDPLDRTSEIDGIGLERLVAQHLKSWNDYDLEAFLQDYPEAKALLLYRGTEYIQQKNVLCLPCEDFLRQLKSGQALWL